MKRLLLFLLSIFISLSISAQEKDDEKTDIRYIYFNDGCFLFR